MVSTTFSSHFSAVPTLVIVFELRGSFLGYGTFHIGLQEDDPISWLLTISTCSMKF